MELALLLVSMAAVVLAATAVSDRLHVPAPLLLIVVGAVASYVPGMPVIHLESEVVLLGLLPPLLNDATRQARDRALPRDPAPGGGVGRARRVVAVVLRPQPHRLTCLRTP